jgi:hypothetical protein
VTAGTAQNGSVAPATASAATAIQPQPWRGNPYVAPVGSGGVSYYSQSSQLQSPSTQHRAPP